MINVIFTANETDQFITQTLLLYTSHPQQLTDKTSFVGIEIAIESRTAISFEVWQEGTWQWGNEIAIGATAIAVSIWLGHSCMNVENEMSNGLCVSIWNLADVANYVCTNRIRNCNCMLSRIWYCSPCETEWETEIRIHIPHTHTHECSLYLHCSSAAPPYT